MGLDLLRIEPPRTAFARDQDARLIVLVRLEMALAHAAGHHGIDLVRIGKIDHHPHRREEIDGKRLLEVVHAAVQRLAAARTLQGEAARQVIQRHTVDARQRSYEVQEERWELVYELRLTDFSSQAADQLVDELKVLEGVAEVSLLAPQLALPL